MTFPLIYRSNHSDHCVSHSRYSQYCTWTHLGPHLQTDLLSVLQKTIWVKLSYLYEKSGHSPARSVGLLQLWLWWTLTLWTQCNNKTHSCSSLSTNYLVQWIIRVAWLQSPLPSLWSLILSFGLSLTKPLFGCIIWGSHKAGVEIKLIRDLWITGASLTNGILRAKFFLFIIFCEFQRKHKVENDQD